jgi:hypothetical protein
MGIPSGAHPRGQWRQREVKIQQNTAASYTCPADVYAGSAQQSGLLRVLLQICRVIVTLDKDA